MSHRIYRSKAAGIVAGLVLAGCLLAAAPARATPGFLEKTCQDSAYACVPGGYAATAATTGSGWAWKYYGEEGAGGIGTPTGPHNCTLYVAWRLQQDGMADPGRAWGNASGWGDALAPDRTPAVGAVAWWRAGNHVAYVERVSGDRIFVTADNYRSQGGGYTDSGWISVASVDGFLHPYRKATKAPPQPAKPAAAQVGGSKAITLTWPAVPGATKYRFQWSNNGGKTWRRGDVVPGAAATFRGVYGRRYLFQVQAGNGVGWGAFSAYSDAVTVRKIPPAEPGKPAAVRAGDSTTVNLTWPAVPGATKYRFQWSNNGGASWKRSAARPGTSATFRGAYNRTYIFQVQAGSAAGWGAFSAYSDAVALSRIPPAEPGKPAATQTGGTTTITLTWPAVPGAVRYHSQWSNDGGATWKSGPTVTGTSATFRGVYGRTYIFQVQAGSAAGWGAYSAYSDAVTLAGGIPAEPGKPTAARSGASSTIILSWLAVPGATKYHVQWSNDGGATWRSGPTVARTSATFGGAAGRTYIFQVQAGSSAGWGPYSAYTDPVTV